MPDTPAFLGAEPRTPTTNERRLEQAAAAARDLITFADGVEDAGHPDLARRSRHLARETLWLVDQHAAEQSARQAIQAARDQAVNLLAQHAYEKTTATP